MKLTNELNTDDRLNYFEFVRLFKYDAEIECNTTKFANGIVNNITRSQIIDRTLFDSYWHSYHTQFNKFYNSDQQCEIIRNYFENIILQLDPFLDTYLGTDADTAFVLGRHLFFLNCCEVPFFIFKGKEFIDKSGEEIEKHDVIIFPNENLILILYMYHDFGWQYYVSNIFKLDQLNEIVKTEEAPYFMKEILVENNLMHLINTIN